MSARAEPARFDFPRVDESLFGELESILRRDYEQTRVARSASG